MSIEDRIDALTQAINENTTTMGELSNLLKNQKEKVEKVSTPDAPKAPDLPASGIKAGLAEKDEPPARAGAPEGASAQATTEPEPKKEEKPAEVFDAEAEKIERSRICTALFGVLKGTMGTREAKEKTREVIDAFTGGAPASDVAHEQHAAFLAHMQKAIDEAQNG